VPIDFRTLVRRGDPSRRPAAGPRGAARGIATSELPAPPSVPDGWRTGPPDFVVIGAQKSGTSWWFSLVAEHPDVHHDATLRRELHFFDRFSSTWPTADDIALYHRYFPRPPGGLAGEKTPEYLADYWVPAQLREAAPEARLIVLLRDPVERYRSAITHYRYREVATDRRVTGDAFARGHYAAQLARLERSFDPARILVLQYEACIADPVGRLGETYRFLGLRPHDVGPDVLGTLRNPTRIEKEPLDPPRHDLLVDLYADDVRRLVERYPAIDLWLWPNFGHLAGDAGGGG
jgi:hypothetical protein